MVKYFKMEAIPMKTISVKIDIRGRIWHNGMRYFSEAEIHGPHWNEHPEIEEYQPTEDEIYIADRRMDSPAGT